MSVPTSGNSGSLQAEVHSYVLKVWEEFTKEGRCKQCCIAKDDCVCEKIRAYASRISPSNQSRPVRIRFLVLMHHEERFKVSNTGKLLATLFPTSMLFLDGDPLDQAASFFMVFLRSLSILPIETNQILSNLVESY